MTTPEPMSSESSDLWGNQEPRFRSVPPAKASLGDKAVEFAAAAGLYLDPWQQDVLRGSMGVGSGGKWAARNVGLLVPRQNGKGSVLEARELFGMFVLNEQTIIHSAHRFDTSQDHFARMRNLIEGNPDLERHVQSTYTANGKESIVLRNGNRLKFKARTLSGSGRGYGSDLLVLDEALVLPEQALSAMSPTQIARPNPQTWFTSSSGYPDSAVLWRMVKRGRSKAKRMAYFEWGCETGADPADPENWAQSNPGLGYRLPMSELEDEFGKLTPEDFAREHLGIWDDQAAGGAFPPEAWDSALDPAADLSGTPTFGVEVAEDRSWACIAAAGADSEGRTVVDAAEYRLGTAWIGPRAAEIARKHRRPRFVVRPGSPGGSLIADLMDRGLVVTQARGQDYSAACGLLYDAVLEGDVRHYGQSQLDVSVAGARRKPSSDAWVWDPRRSGLDISPLVAVTLAMWGSQRKVRPGRFVSF